MCHKKNHTRLPTEYPNNEQSRENQQDQENPRSEWVLDKHESLERTPVHKTKQ